MNVTSLTRLVLDTSVLFVRREVSLRETIVQQQNCLGARFIVSMSVRAHTDRCGRVAPIGLIIPSQNTDWRTDGRTDRPMTLVRSTHCCVDRQSRDAGKIYSVCDVMANEFNLLKPRSVLNVMQQKSVSYSNETLCKGFKKIWSQLNETLLQTFPKST